MRGASLQRVAEGFVRCALTRAADSSTGDSQGRGFAAVTALPGEVERPRQFGLPDRLASMARQVFRLHTPRARAAAVGGREDERQGRAVGPGAPGLFGRWSAM